MNTMNPTHTDEELRLLRKLADEAISCWPKGSDTEPYERALDDIIAHRAKASTNCIGCRGSGKTYPAVAGFAEPEDRGPLGPCGMCGGTGKASAPVTPERCEPPADRRHHKWHWLSYRVDAGLEPWQELWHFDGNDHWSSYGIAFGRDPVSQAAEGWSWHSVASPSNTDIREPTDEAIEKFHRDTWYPTHIIRAVLAHFSPTVSPVEPKSLGGEFTNEDAAKVGHSLMDAIHASRDHPLMKDWAPAEDPAEIVLDLLMAYDEKTPTQPAGSVQREVSDEALDELIDAHWLAGKADIRELLRATLTKHHPSISDKQLIKLRTIALTHDGVDLYLTDARRVVGR